MINFILKFLDDILHPIIRRDAMREINRIIIHCSATKPDLNIGADSITEWHVRKGWSDIGYHDVIKRDGTIEEGRPVEKIGAHTKGYNEDSIGIVLVGGIDKDGKPSNNFTPNQYKSLRRLLRFYKVQYKKATIHGHNEFNKYKACPSFDVQEWLKGEKI